VYSFTIPAVYWQWVLVVQVEVLSWLY